MLLSQVPDQSLNTDANLESDFMNSYLDIALFLKWREKCDKMIYIYIPLISHLTHIYPQKLSSTSFFLWNTLNSLKFKSLSANVSRDYGISSLWKVTKYQVQLYKHNSWEQSS